MLDMSCFENEDFRDFTAEDSINAKAFKNCNFSGADLSDITIYSCKFDNCNFSGSKLNGSVIKSSAFINCKFRYASLFAAEFTECKMTGSAFVGADCVCFQVQGGDWSYTDLRENDFSKMNLSHVNFSGADLRGCDFSKSSVRYCNFDEALLTGVSFCGADLRDSTLYNTDIFGINLKNAKVDLELAVCIASAHGVKYEP